MCNRACPRAGFLLFSIALIFCGCRQPDENKIVVFAAASLTDVVADLATRFEESHPKADVVVNLSGSSILARQIIAGAHYDVFLSANEEWVSEVDRAESLASSRSLLISNRLVVVWRDNRHDRSESPVDLNQLLSEAERIAIADPAHVPAGIYAKEALECEGLWDMVEEMIVPTLDVRAVVASVLSGNVDTGIVYASDTGAADLKVQPIDTDCQPTIGYAAALSSNAGDLGQSFYTFVDDSLQHDLWTRHGFTLRND